MIKTNTQLVDKLPNFSMLDDIAPKDYDREECLKKFIESAQQNRMNVTVVGSAEEAKKFIALATKDSKKVYIHEYLEAWYLRLKDDINSISANREDFRDLDIAIVPGGIGIADSGSIIFYADYLEEALITVPKKLIILLGIERVIPSISTSVKYLAGIWKELFGGTRSLSIFSAPSRTGDIEKKVVMGAHGPREVDIVIMNWYRELIGKLGKFALPHYRLVPLAFSEEEKAIRRLGGSLGLLDIAVYASLGGEISSFVNVVSEFYSRFGIDISSVLGDYL